MSDLRPTPLEDRHRALGASMTGFGGWDMPLHYGSVVAEHRAVRESCGVFDLSHLGTLRITGPDAGRVVQHAFTNDVTALDVGGCHYTLCLNDEAGIVDDLILSRFSWGFWAVPNAANSLAVESLLRQSAEGHACEVTDVKDVTACLAIQGPASPDVLLAAGIETNGLPYMQGRELSTAMGGEPLLTRTGYTGEIGYEVVVPTHRAPKLWDDIVAGGATPAGLGCRDTLRLEMGYPLHGNDISPATTPVEARLAWAVKVATGFRGEDAYIAARDAGPTRRLWGLRALSRGIPRAGQRVSVDDRTVGETTSGTFSPTGQLGIALAYLSPDLQAGDRVDIDVRGKALPAEVMRPPFVKASPK